MQNLHTRFVAWILAVNQTDEVYLRFGVENGDSEYRYDASELQWHSRVVAQGHRRRNRRGGAGGLGP